MNTAFLSVTEAAHRAGCTVSYVRRLLRNGSITGQKIGRSYWILEKSEADKLRKALGKRGCEKKPCKK